MTPEVPHLVITGGEGALAAAFVAEFEQAGWKVDAPGRSRLDVTSPESVAAYFMDRRVDLLICNAGRVKDARIPRLSPADWEHLWQVNYRGALDCANAVLKAMSLRRCGHVLLVSSHSALSPPTGQSAYAAAKAALLGLTGDLASQYGPSGIRVNAILPGFLETRMTTGVSPARRQEVLSEHVLGRFNTPGRVARFARFLHEEQPHTSGQFFQLDSRPRHP